VSKTRNVAFNDATPAELRMFLQQSCGITAHTNCTPETLRAKVRAVFEGDEISLILPDDPEIAAKAPPNEVRSDGQRMVSKGGKGDPVVELTLMEQEGPAGKRPVFVSVNGKAMLIPRSKRVQVPYRYYDVLRNAVRSEVLHVTRGATTEELHNDVPEYNMQVHKEPSAAELNAWHARVGRQFAA
jgi:hypothetical protein